MTQFEFVLVFVSLVVAFAVSDILSSWGEQLRLRRVVRHYALHTAWSVLLLFVMMQAWWSLWDLNEYTWTFVKYLALIVPFLTLAQMAYLLTPSFDEPDANVKHHYFDSSRWFFALGAFYLAAWAFFSYVILGSPLDEPGSQYRFLGIVLMIVLAVFPNERLHVIAVVLAYLMMGAWLAAVVV